MQGMTLTKMSYLLAAKLKEERDKPNGKPDALDFAVKPECFWCQASLEEGPGKPVVVCGACKGIVYCSKKCQTLNWKNGKISGAENHKQLCANNKRHMERAPVVRSIIKQFPWGKVEMDGSFSLDIATASFGTLGDIGSGYWSRRVSLSPHAPSPSIRNDGPKSAFNEMFGKTAADYCDGYLMLEAEWPSDADGWKLKDRSHVPRLAFSGTKAPPLATETEIANWDTWYRWRGLSKASPAALLMHFPLSVYQLLVHVLYIASPHWGSKDKRHQFTVHYLGAEMELNMIPLFSELALLLPYTDIKLVFFGSAVQQLVALAKKKHPQSIAGKSSQQDPVYAYQAPEACGSATIKMYLASNFDDWTPSAATGELAPDALVAPNAGLLSYQGWFQVITFCHAQELPFAVTEYAEQSAETQANQLRSIAMAPLKHPAFASGVSPAERIALTREREYPIELNPFHRPGQRGIPSIRLPNLQNGYTLRVVGSNTKAEAKARARFTRDNIGGLDKLQTLAQALVLEELEELD